MSLGPTTVQEGGELKRAIVTEWQKLPQRFIDNSINEWRRRLEAVIKNGSGHIEHCNLA